MAVQLRKNLPTATPLTIYDVDADTSKRYLEESPDNCGPIHIARSPKELTEEVVSTQLEQPTKAQFYIVPGKECIITVLSTEEDIEEIYLKSDFGILSANRRGKIFIDRFAFWISNQVLSNDETLVQLWIGNLLKKFRRLSRTLILRIRPSSLMPQSLKVLLKLIKGQSSFPLICRQKVLCFLF